LRFEDGAKAKVANGEDFLLFPGSPRGSAPSELINFSAWFVVLLFTFDIHCLWHLGLPDQIWRLTSPQLQVSSFVCCMRGG
jgi:hypothetical protein